VKTLVFEGTERKRCPICEPISEHGYGQMPLALAPRELVTSLVQGGAIGAGAATILDFIIPKLPIIKTLPATIRPLVNGGVSVLAAVLLYKRNPSLAIGIGIGGTAVAAYKFIATLMGKVATVPPAAAAGWGQEEEMEGTGEIEIESTGTGVIVPIEETAGFAYGEEVLID